MKKTALWIALMGMFAAFGQPTGNDSIQKKEEVEIQIEGNKVTIETDDPEQLKNLDLTRIIADAYKKAAEIEQQRAMALERIQRQLEAKEITEEEADELRDQVDERAEESSELLEEAMESWGEAYEARWEAWADEYEAKMEAWETEMELRADAGQPIPPMPPLPPMPGLDAGVPAPPSVPGDTNRRIIIDEDGITIKRKKGGDEPFALRFEDDEDVDEDEEDDDEKHFDRTEWYTDIFFLGFNQQLVDGSQLISSVSPQELNFWKSTSFAFGMGGKSRLGSPFSKFYIKYGLELSAHNFRLTDNNFLAMSPVGDSVMFAQDTNLTSFDKSKYYISYFNIPVMFQLDLSDVGDMDEAFTLGVGGYVGIRMKAKRELEYATDQYSEVEEKAYSDYYTSTMRYGLMAELGYDSFKVRASYDLNPFFEDGRGPSYNMFNIAVGLTF